MTCLHLYRQVRVRVNRDWSNRPLTVMELTQRASWRGLNLRSEAVTAPPAEAQACFTRSHQETLSFILCILVLNNEVQMLSMSSSRGQQKQRSLRWVCQA